MKNRKKLFALLLAGIMVLSLCACGGNGDSNNNSRADDNSDTQEKIKISVGGTAADGNPMQELIYYFEQQVDDLVPGMVEWGNYPNCTIGSEREMGEMVLDGTLDAALQGPSNLTAFAPMKACRMQDMPFVFQDRDELYDATNEWMRDMINEECAPYGFTTVFYEYIMGQEIENTKRPIYTPDDVKGMKIRVYDSPGPYNFLKACGGLPVSMAFSEVYTGVQQGAIDGLYTTTSNFVPQKFVEVCEYHTKMTITNLGMTLIWNLEKLDSYPQELQDAIKTAAAATETYCREDLGPKTAESAYDQIAAAGVKINEVTPEQYQVFADLIADYCYDDLRDEVGADLWDYCMDWLKEYRSR